MPYVNIKVTQEGGPKGVGPSDQQKRDLIQGVTTLLSDVLGKDPATTHVVIDEVPITSWGWPDDPFEISARIDSST